MFKRICNRLCKKVETSEDFMEKLEVQHKREKKDMKLKEKLLNDNLEYLESITIII